MLTSLTYPIIQAPMAGGATTPEFVAAACQQGILGSLAGALLKPQAIIEQSQQIRRLTQKPFAINLFVLAPPSPIEADALAAQASMATVYQALNIEAAPLPDSYCQDFELQFEALLEAAPAVASFTFAPLSAEHVCALKARNIFVIGTATQAEEALIWQDLNVDAVCLQGIEAGGHNGKFLSGQALPLAELITACREIRLPKIAAGGLMSSDDIKSTLLKDITACQLGTAFLACPESGIHPVYKQRLLAGGETAVTRAFSGKYARGLKNEFMRLMLSAEASLPAYPIQNALTGPIRAAAAAQDNPEFMSLWAGTGVNKIKAQSMAAIVQDLTKLL